MTKINVGKGIGLCFIFAPILRLLFEIAHCDVFLMLCICIMLTIGIGLVSLEAENP